MDAGTVSAGNHSADCLPFIYNFVLLKISSAERHYRTAGDLRDGFRNSYATDTLLSRQRRQCGVDDVFGFPGSSCSSDREYNEYRGHAAVLMGVDIILSEKWRSLWRWYIGMFAVAIGRASFSWYFPW